MITGRKLDGALSRAAAAAGIGASFVDGLGQAREVPDDTVVACLEAMGFEPAKQSFHAIASEIGRRRRQAPLAILAEGRPGRILAATRRDAGPCTIVTEAGRTVATVLSPDGMLTPHRELPLGYHRLSFGPEGREIGLALCPLQGFWPPWMERGERRWGLAAQIYSLRSTQTDSMGDFADLAELIDRLGEGGGDAVLINPVVAGFLAEPNRKSPYQASDRRFLNALMIDTGAPAGDVSGPYIDYRDAVPARLAALRGLFHDLQADEMRAFRGWLAAAPSSLQAFAAWEAGTFAASGHAAPKEGRFHAWLQFRADRELGACAEAARARGMTTGLVRDLPVGPAQDGFETLSQPGIFARNIDVGAPPDLLAPKGQNWGIAAYNPIALADAGYAPFIALLRANMRHAGALRIDHVMSLSRLFWIPRDTETGAYVRYPFEELAALTCLESMRAHCVVIGEDLGTVPAGLRAKLRARRILGTRVVSFERRKDGSLIRPSRYPYATLSQTSTHDMPTFAAWWRSAGRHERRDFAQALQNAVPNPPLPIKGDALGFRASFLRLTQFLAQTTSALCLFRLEDIALERRSINVPGTGDDAPNWSLRLRRALRDLLHPGDATRVWRVIIKAMQSSR